MLPAPPEIVCCPKCGQGLLRHSLLSGNTFGAAFYSDGRMVAPMLPEFPAFSRCPSCGAFFWVKDLKGGGGGRRPYPDIEELTVTETAQFLESGLVHERGQEIFVRIKLWHAFGDRVRDSRSEEENGRCETKLIETPEEQELWEGNLRRLLELQPEEELMIAEIYRQLGQFDEAMEVLNAVLTDEEKSEKWPFAAQMKDHCEKKDRGVFRFSDD